MHEPDQRSGVKLPALSAAMLKTGLFFGAVSAVVAAGGVDDLVQVSQRNVGQGIVLFAFSLPGFYLAGRMLWTYRRLQKGHGLTRRALDNLALLDHPDRPNWMRLLYIALGVGAGGASAAWQGAAMLASSKPYHTSLGATAVIIAVISFLIAGYFWWRYCKKRSRAIRDVNTPADAEPHAEHEQ